MKPSKTDVVTRMSLLLSGLVVLGTIETQSLYAQGAAAPAPDHMKDATTPMRRRDGGYLHLHQSFTNRAGRGGIDLLFVGDSITADWVSVGKQIWDLEYEPLRAANMGISGDMTQFMLWRLSDGEMDHYKPKVVVLMAGTNNIKSGPTRMPPDAVAAGVAALIKQFRTRWPDARILLLGILPRQPECDWIADVVRETNSKLKGLAESDDHVTFLDFGAKYLDADGKLRKDLMPDMLHPNAEGYQIWADAMRDTLAKLMK